MCDEIDKDQRLYFQGRDALAKGDFGSAIEYFKESINCLPHFKTYESIGVCFMNLNDYPNAAIYLSAAVGIAPNQSRPLYLLAMTLTNIGEIDAAREKLLRALAINPHYKSAKDLLNRIDHSSL